MGPEAEPREADQKAQSLSPGAAWRTDAGYPPTWEGNQPGSQTVIDLNLADGGGGGGGGGGCLPDPYAPDGYSPAVPDGGGAELCNLALPGC